MTYRGCYQVLLIFFLVVAPIQAAIDLQFVRTLHSTTFALLLTGLLLLPTSAIGLWSDKYWGLLLLVIAIGLCLFTSLGGAIGALIVLPLAAFRLHAIKRRKTSRGISENVVSRPTK
jgi:hypothetical protein